MQFLGWQRDMLPVYHAADMFVLPSWYGEGVPVSLLEAGACEIPVVTTSLPGCADPVRDGQTGLLVPPKSVAALEVAIEALALSPERRAQMGRAARAHVCAEFGAERAVSAQLSNYQRLLARHS